MHNPTIAVINESTVVSDEDVKDLIWALQTQVDRDFSPFWATGGHLVFQEKGTPTAPGVWQLVILDNSDQAGALGYHELTANGDPLGKVFAGDDIKFGSSWTITASHELLEMLADPWINLAAQTDDKTLYAYEVCDACEGDQFGYPIGVPGTGKVFTVSDFVTPNWFQPLVTNIFPLDFKGYISKPLQLLPDGYISVLEMGSGSGWTQLNGEFTSKQNEERSVPQVGHRRYRRAIARSGWHRSTHS